MSTASTPPPEEDYQFSADDDAYSTGADSGFDMGHDEALLKKEESRFTFFSRLVSIPIIQDSLTSAQNMVCQHPAGQKAFDFAETKLQTIATTAKPYFEESSLFAKADDIGNKSLDMLQHQFPSITSPTEQFVQPVTGRIHTAVSHFKEKKSVMIDARLDTLANRLEVLMNEYLPPQEPLIVPTEEEVHGMDRLLHTVNTLSTRALQRATSTKEEEKQMKHMISAWVSEQAPIKSMYSFTQTEYDKVLQELNKTNISHMDKLKNILLLSQTDVLVPLYQKSRSMISNQQQKPVAAT